jgi:hypothetical protein
MTQPTTSDANFAQTKGDEALPLPGWLTKIYYIFPIVLYVPDMLFNFYVYSDGSGLNPSKFTFENLPGFLLWGFLAAGIVGMAWLCSVLAPWHWIKGNKFQSIMCWFGVVIATSITIWNSLAYRSLNFKVFATDLWFAQAFHVNITGFSPTMILVSVAPPFWGLFWAIVQPAVGRKSMAEEQESHQLKLERMKQEAEYKRLRAEANAGVRAAQLKGLAATARAARAQISGQDATVQEEEQQGNVIDAPTNAERVVALPTASIRRLSERRPAWNEETTESGEHAVIQGAAASMSYSVAAAPRDDVFEAPSGEFNARPLQGTLLNNSTSGEHEAIRPGMPRASTLLRNYADGEHVMRAVDADVERMRNQGMKVTIKSFAEYRGIELSLSKQLLAKWREWKQGQAQPAARAEMAE